MSLPYVPRGSGEEARMLAAIGVERFEDLLAPLPEGLRLDGLLDLPAPKSELEVTKHMERLADRNAHGGNTRVFLGAGNYEHMIPAAVDTLSFRSEYYTAYTPYQAEVGQGTLTTIFEFQTMMAELTGMDLANASLYDGATALAEAMLLATAVTKRKRVLVAGPVHPHYLEVLRTFAAGQDVEIVHDPAPDGRVDRSWLADALASEPAAVVAQFPNFFGITEDLTEVFARAQEAGAKAVAVIEPHALALYRTPAAMGADIAVGEGISLGTPPSFGGPALGLFACKQEFARHIPGRLIGETVDRDGKRAFVMTLRTREQDIRRERATSNICTNQGLMALRAVIYLSLLGTEGFREVGEHCLERAHHAAERLDALDGYSLRFPDAPFFHEFVLTCPKPAREIMDRAAERDVLPGLSLNSFGPVWDRDTSHELLVSVTEMHDRADLDALVSVLEEVGRG